MREVVAKRDPKGRAFINNSHHAVIIRLVSFAFLRPDAQGHFSMREQESPGTAKHDIITKRRTTVHIVKVTEAMLDEVSSCADRFHSIHVYLRALKQIAVNSTTPIVAEGEYNMVIIRASSETNLDNLYGQYRTACSGEIIGPTSRTPEEQEKAEHRRRIRELSGPRIVVDTPERRAKRAELDEELAGVEFALVPGLEDDWKAFAAEHESQGQMGEEIAFMLRWAKLMQRDMANGAQLEDVWRRAELQADLSDAYPSAAAAAMGAALEKFWVHGPELAKLRRRA